MGGMHSDQDGPGYPPGGGRGFGYNRGGFRGRGGFPVRPGMGRGFEHGPPPGDMGRGGPWMGMYGGHRFHFQCTTIEKLQPVKAKN